MLWLLLISCTPEAPPPPPPPPTVVMISMDTTHADALSCYAPQNEWGLGFPADSRPAPATPTLDGLATRGVRFAWALAHAPTTLSSHTSVFSGRDPHRHRVVRNGYPVPTDYPLLAERFADAGWDTLAVVASSALEAKMGLGRGFRVYQDPGPQPPGGMIVLPADEVARRALAAVDARDPHADAPLFLFVHFYDAHMPWFTAPADVVSRFTRASYDGPVDGTMNAIGLLTRARIAGTLRYGDARQARGLYLAQVAWVDQQLGVLLDGLESRGLMTDSLVVALADHGETLDESPTHPYTHGPQTMLVDLHVPLVFSGRGRYALPAGAVVNRVVGLRDVGSTVQKVVGLSGLLGDGEDLSALWSGARVPAPPLFAEATRPMGQESTTHWNNLPFERSVVLGGRMLRLRPLEKGAATMVRVAPGEPPLAELPGLQAMADLLRQWDTNAPAYRPPEYDEETRRALEALGYLR